MCFVTGINQKTSEFIKILQVELSMIVCHHNVFNWRYRHVVFEKVRPAEKANHFESKGCCLMPASLFKLKNFKGKFPDTKKHSAARIKEGITFFTLSLREPSSYVCFGASLCDSAKKWPAIAVHCSFLPNCSHEWNFSNLRVFKMRADLNENVSSTFSFAYTYFQVEKPIWFRICIFIQYREIRMCK